MSDEEVNNYTITAMTSFVKDFGTSNFMATYPRGTAFVLKTDHDKQIKALKEIIESLKQQTQQDLNAEVSERKEIPDFLRDFVNIMIEIDAYGRRKYNEKSIQVRIENGNYEIWDRIETQALVDHANDHFQKYSLGIKHDHFHTLKHQLGAVAFNALMEFKLARLEEEKADENN